MYAYMEVDEKGNSVRGMFRRKGKDKSLAYALEESWDPFLKDQGRRG